MPGRYETASRGDLVDYSYEGPYGGHKTGRGVVESVEDGTVRLEAGWTLHTGSGSLVGPDGSARQLYRVEVVVPASQVRHPGVGPGDVVKFRHGDQTARVERVEDGVVHTHDGWSRPVTQVTAFDEDTGSHDPFSIADGYESLFGPR